MEEERREQERTQIPKILVRVGSSETFREEFLGDLSEGGIFVSSSEPLQEGSDVEIELLPPGWTDPISLTGRVVRRASAESPDGRTGMGVQFEDLAPASSEALAELLAEYSEEEMPEERGMEWAERETWKEEIELLHDELAEERKAATHHAREKQKADRQVELMSAKLAEVKKERDELEQVQVALEADLEVARQAKDAEEKLERELGQLRSENRRLRTLVTNVETRTEALQERLERHEEQHEAAKVLAESLAREKEELERLYKEGVEEVENLKQENQQLAQAVHEQSESVERLRAVEEELETTKQELAQSLATHSELEESLEYERSERASATQRADSAEAELTEALEAAKQVPELKSDLSKLRVRMAEARNKVDESKGKAVDALEELEKVRHENRDLMRQLTAAREAQKVPTGAQDEEDLWGTKEIGSIIEAVAKNTPLDAPATVQATGPPAESPARPKAQSDEIELPDASSGPPAAQPVAAPPANPKPPEARAQDHPVEVEADEEEEGDPDALIQRAQAILSGISSPPDSTLAPDSKDKSPARKTEPKARPAKRAATKRAKPARKKQGPIETVEEFERRLRAGALIKKTPRFSRLEPVSRNDIQVSDWLKETESFPELQKLAGGKMSDSQMIGVIYIFFQRSLVELDG